MSQSRVGVKIEKSTFAKSGVNLDLRAPLAPAASNGSKDTSISGFTPVCAKVGFWVGNGLYSSRSLR